MDPVKAYDVCLFDNTSGKICHWMGYYSTKVTKNAGFPISTTDCTYAFCTSGIFLYWRLKDTTKKKKNPRKNALMRPDPDLEFWFLYSWASRTLAFDIYDFLDDLWLEFFLVFFLTCVFLFFLSFDLSFFILKKQRVSDCQKPFFLRLISFSFPFLAL